MEADERARENQRFLRDIFLALAATFFGSGVVAIVLTVLLTNDDALGLGLRPAATATTFMLFLAASAVSLVAAVRSHVRVTR